MRKCQILFKLYLASQFLLKLAEIRTSQSLNDFSDFMLIFHPKKYEIYHFWSEKITFDPPPYCLKDLPLSIKPLCLLATWEYLINLILLKWHSHHYPISSSLLLKSFICTSLSWLGIAIRSGKSQGLWIYTLLKKMKFLINEACWSFIIYGWGPLNCTRSSSLCPLRKGFVVSFLLRIWGEIRIFQIILSRRKSILKMPWEIVMEKNLD